MRRIRNKSNVILLIVLIVVIAGLGTGVFFFERVPQRVAAGQINREIDLPFKLFDKPNFDNKQYGCLGGVGVVSYFDLSYLNEGNESIRRDGTMMLLNGPIVYYNVTSYPDMLCKTKRITYIECSDPAYRIYGCSVGNTAEQFDKALSAAGFSDMGYNVYKRSSIFVSLYLDGKKKVAYYVIRAEVGNLLKLRA
jgi:hypothetical protein